MANPDNPDNPKDSLQEQLKVLREAYAAKLPEEIRKIEETWNSLQKQNQPNQWNDEAFKTWHRLIHTLSGTGTTFGFPTLSDAARKLEIYLSSIIEKTENAALPTESQRKEINALLTALKQAAIPIRPDQSQSSDAETHRPELAESPHEVEVDEGVIILDELDEEEDNKLIFLVEDDPYLAQNLTLQIGHFGYSMRTFTQLAGLEEAVIQSPPKAIIMDIMFPEGSLAGPKAIAEIQKTRETPIPVIFISSRSDLMARLQAVRAGASAYFTKPIDIGSLVDQLDILTARQTPEPYRILIVEDDSILAAHYALTLRQAGMLTQVVTDPMQIGQPLAEFRPDLILMDIYMPGCNGMELAAVIRQQKAYVDISIVFLSRETDRDKQLSAMHLGGDDFLTKPIQDEHLISSVSARAERFRILCSFMVRDSLTGLLNHNKIKEQLNIELARAKRENIQLSFGMIDIDHFKSVNDTYGHPTGDQVIKNLSLLLKQRLRRTDIIGRYGGEEFAVILPHTEGPNAVKVLNEIRASFAQVRQQSQAGAEFSVTFSCGVADFPNYDDVTSLNNAADKALYEAKRQGRNRLVLANKSAL